MHAQSPGASEKEIKQAYYRVMRACHPDVAVSLDEDDDGEAGEVCVFVNDIYEVPCFRMHVLPCSQRAFSFFGALAQCVVCMQTLMDAERRAAYDAIAGFSGGAVNPFSDRSYERNQVLLMTLAGFRRSMAGCKKQSSSAPNGPLSCATCRCL
jgi:hypothetical protein